MATEGMERSVILEPTSGVKPCVSGFAVGGRDSREALFRYVLFLAHVLTLLELQYRFGDKLLIN